MTNNSTKGLLISFDGIDSSGKETQARLFAEKIEKQGYLVKCFATPDYTTKTGQRLKALFQGTDRSWDDLSWREQMALLAANRAEHKQEVITTLNQKGIVIYDRYVPSSLAHMAVSALTPSEIASKRAQVIEEVSEYEYIKNGMPRENLSIFLDIPPKLAFRLLENRKNILSEKDEATDHIDLQERIYNEYQGMTSTQPDHFTRVECVRDGQLLSIDLINELVWEKATARLPQLAKTP